MMIDCYDDVWRCEKMDDDVVCAVEREPNDIIDSEIDQWVDSFDEKLNIDDLILLSKKLDGYDTMDHQEPEPSNPLTHTLTHDSDSYKAHTHAKNDCMWGEQCDDRPDEPDNTHDGALVHSISNTHTQDSLMTEHECVKDVFFYTHTQTLKILS